MSASTPAVSVIIPTYNRADVLGRSIESVLDQSYRDFELIVVDDGSADDTADVVRSFGDSRIELIEHGENRGASAARNTGIRAAVGEYIAFQDSDDEWLPEKLQKQMKIFEEAPPSVGVVYTGFWRVEGGTRSYHPSSETEHKEGDVHESLLRRNFITTQAAVVRKQCFSRVGGFDERLPRFQDWELWIRLSKEYAFRLIDEPLVIAHDRPDSISNDPQALVEARELILKKHGDAFNRGQLADQLFRLGHSSLKTHQTKKGRKYLTRAIRTDPTPLYAVCFILSLFGAEVYNRAYRLYRQV